LIAIPVARLLDRFARKDDVEPSLRGTEGDEAIQGRPGRAIQSEFIRF
jgi:hypothetical protein